MDLKQKGNLAIKHISISFQEKQVLVLNENDYIVKLYNVTYNNQFYSNLEYHYIKLSNQQDAIGLKYNGKIIFKQRVIDNKISKYNFDDCINVLTSDNLRQQFQAIDGINNELSNLSNE